MSDYPGSIRSIRRVKTALDGTEHFEGQDASGTFKALASTVATPSQAVLAALGILPGRPKITARRRILGGVQVGSGAFTAHMLIRAPAAYDAVQIILPSASTAGPVTKVSVASTASAAGTAIYAPVDGNGNSVSFTPVTFGSTNALDPRNPGGGVATASPLPIAGTQPLIDLVEGYAASDIIPLASFTRTDTPTAPPLFMVRVYATNGTLYTAPEFSRTGANPMSAYELDFFSGLWSGTDYTATSNPGAAPTSNTWAPAIEIIFYLRGTRVYTIAAVGDSLDQGYTPSTCVNGPLGSIASWSRRLADNMNAAGIPTNHYCPAAAGDYSLVSVNRGINALLQGGLGITHMFMKPFSVNEGSTPDTAGDMRRFDTLLSLAYEKRIQPIVVRPWAGQGMGTAAMNTMQAYIDSLAASGVPVFDARSLVSASGGLTDNNIATKYQALNSGGTQVDAIHVNAQAHNDIGDLATTQRIAWGLV